MVCIARREKKKPTREEALAEALAAMGGGAIGVFMPPATALAVVGAIQLALRRKDFPATVAKRVRCFIDAVRDQVSPEVQEMIDRGFDPKHDVESSEL